MLRLASLFFGTSKLITVSFRVLGLHNDVKIEI